MNNNPIYNLSAKKLIVIGASCVFMFLVLWAFPVGSSSSQAEINNCLQQVEKQYAQLAELDNFKRMCENSPGYVAMMEAKARGLGAKETARLISEANNNPISEGILINLLKGLLIGLGIGMLGLGFFKLKKESSNVK